MESKAKRILSALPESGVDISETILWLARGGKQGIERRQPLPGREITPWSAWTVRDTDIPLLDAVTYSEWLLSSVASHRVKDLTPALAP